MDIQWYQKPLLHYYAKTFHYESFLNALFCDAVTDWLQRWTINEKIWKFGALSRQASTSLNTSVQPLICRKLHYSSFCFGTKIGGIGICILGYVHVHEEPIRFIDMNHGWILICCYGTARWVKINCTFWKCESKIRQLRAKTVYIWPKQLLCVSECLSPDKQLLKPAPTGQKHEWYRAWPH